MAQQPKAAMLTNRPPSTPMSGASYLNTLLRASASGVPLELAAPSAESSLAQLGRRAIRDVQKESQGEKKSIVREAKEEASRGKIDEIEAAGKSRIEQAMTAGGVSFLQQLARAELTRMKEEDAENLANLKQAAKEGRDSFFDFLDAAEQRGIEFESEDINDALRLVPGAERERRLAREAYRQNPVNFTRGEEYMQDLAQRSLAERQAGDPAAAAARLRSIMGLPEDTGRPVFTSARAFEALGPEAESGLLPANPFDQPLPAALKLAFAEDSILNTQGSRAVGAAAKNLQLREGAEGSEVLQAQKALKALPGFENVSLVGGKYDESFKDAVIEFQKSQGLSADGILGPNTYEALYRELYNRAAMQERLLLKQRQQEANIAAQISGGVL